MQTFKNVGNMKKIAKLFIVTLFLLSGTGLFAQSKLKIGHINSTELFQMMPQRDSVEKVLDKYMDELEETLESMQAEFRTKYNNYMEKYDSLSDFVRQTKEEELSQLQQRIQAFQSNAQQNYQVKEEELFSPIIEQAKVAIRDVAKENGYTYVLDTGTGAVLFKSEDSDNILPLVKKKLGLE